MLPRTSAADKPWTIFRDDPSREDLFEVSLESFEQAWDNAMDSESMIKLLDSDTRRRESLRAAEQTVMIAYSEDNKWALEQLERVVRELSKDKIKTIHFQLENGSSAYIGDVIEGMLSSASAGVVLMFNDETIHSYTRKSTSKTDRVIHRSRQNVVHELGLMQARYGFERVLVLTESSDSGQEFDIPSNIHGRDFKSIKFSNGRMDEESLTAKLTEFVNSLSR